MAEHDTDPSTVSDDPDTGSRHRESIIALSEWLETAPGRYVLAWEQAQFDALVADIFGFNAVQIGLMELQSLRSNRMPFVFAASEPSMQGADASAVADASKEPLTHLKTQVYMRLEELPFASQSIDLLVLPHALEFADDPHLVLREVERVLMPEGQVVISGFNPISLWGLRQVIGRSFNAPFLPREGQFLALPRLKDWLKLLGFEVNPGHFGCYRPPFNRERWQARFGFMERAGERWWSYGGAIYIVHAIKRVQGMRLIGPSWKDKKRLAAALQPTVNRSREPVLEVERSSGSPRDALHLEAHGD
jgi:SAM-dependent methyltransferase